MAEKALAVKKTRGSATHSAESMAKTQKGAQDKWQN